MSRRAGALVVIFLAACSTVPATPSAPSAPPPAAQTVTPSAMLPSPASEPGEASPSPSEVATLTWEMATFDLPDGSGPHDVAPAADGGVWYTGQRNGTLGWLDPASGQVIEIPLGAGSAPHGVITGPDGDAWVTDGGLNAIVRVDADAHDVTVHPIPAPNANLNTATFDADGTLWFTGQAGWYGSLDPDDGTPVVYQSPRGAGPYGIATMPDGDVVYSSLAGSYLGFIDRDTGEVEVVATPTPGGGARRVWSDSRGGLWVTEWFAGRLARYEPAEGTWQEWPLPGESPQPYAVFVDERDAVWVTDFGANATLRFDPATEEWTAFEHASAPAEVRQLLGRPGETWGAESAADRLVVIRERP